MLVTKSRRDKLYRIALALLLTAALTAGSLLGSPGAAHAEGPDDPAPVLQPVGQANGKSVLFDNTHGQTAGAADWVIDGAFSDYGEALADEGYLVTELRKTTPITHADLSDYDVYVIPEANIPYKASEQAAMLQYVENGGSIFFISDHYNADRNKNRWDSSEAFNGYRRGAWLDPAAGMSAEERQSPAMQGVVSSDWLGENFGVRFRYNALGNVTANQIVSPAQSFGITDGVSAVAMHAGSTLAIMDPEKAKGIVYLPATNAAWPNAVDQGVYEGGGIDEGPYAAIAKVGAGKAAFIGDSSPVEDATPKYLREETGGTKKTYDGFEELDDATLLVNIVNWLAQQESYTKLSDVPGLQLDQPTSLLAMEAPATSTEPQAEPWSQPAAGYKWWDGCTFKPGSYGYDSTCGSGGGGGTATNDLFISEYVEGSSYNKAIEIYNGTGAAVDLTGYSLVSSNQPNSPIALGGTLADGDVYVVANPGASTAILAAADATSSLISFNGDDAVTLKKSASVIDVVGTSGVAFGTDKTLVRKETVTSGSTSYAAAEWDAYAKDTAANLGSHTAAAAQVVLSEDFESGSKGAYAAGNVTLASGSWAMDNALIGDLSTDRKEGAKAVRLRAAGALTMNFDVNGADEVSLKVANFGSDTGAVWKLQQSTNGGASWTDVAPAQSATSALVQHTVAVDESSNVRFRIAVSGTSGQRLNVDGFEIRQ